MFPLPRRAPEKNAALHRTAVGVIEEWIDKACAGEIDEGIGAEAALADFEYELAVATAGFVRRSIRGNAAIKLAIGRNASVHLNTYDNPK